MNDLHQARHRWFARILQGLAIAWPLLIGHDAAAAHTPADLLKQSDIPGGLIVQVGWDDASAIAGLRLHQGFKVMALDIDAAKVAAARKAIQSDGEYGDVMADRFDGQRLPLIDNVANAVFVVQPGRLAEAEILRVLCPDGVAYVLRDGRWDRLVKPRPEAIDIWTHFLHDPSNNAVAHDRVIDAPRRLQWTGGPRYSRHHDHMASVSAMVSNGPQVFYIIDMGSRWSIEMPANWQLVARDAFNGTTLWTKPMGRWFTHHYALKSGPADLPRRLVAVGDAVFFTPALDAPLEKVDAATGRTLKRYAGTAATEEILYQDGILLLKVNRPENQLAFDTIQAARNLNGGVPFNLDPRRILAVDAESGDVLWQRASVVMPGTLAADSKRVYYHDGEAVVCLDRDSGDPMWKQPVSRWSKMQTFFTPTLVVYEGIVLFAGGEKMVPHRGGKDSMTAMDAQTGDILWTAYHPQGGYMSAEDVLVAGGLVWAGETTNGGYSGMFTGRDPKTGEVKIEFEPDVETYWFHHRCYRGKATDDFLLMSRTGIEVLDPARKHWTINHWVRGGCLYGIMPCNGLIYTPPSNCACYPEIKLFGFNALAPKGSSVAPSAPSADGRLERGPAYASEPPPAVSSPQPCDWPTYRGDNRRSGGTQTAVSAEVSVRWTSEIGGRLSAPVIAGGWIYAAAIDAHTVCALSEQDGRTQWTYTAGGRIDSPPTVYQGRVYFGSADGWVYCLRAADGQLAWRYLAAPCDRRLVAYDQVESLWPVRGSVLIEDGRLYTVAGRNAFLDGGLRLVILDPATGALLRETQIDDVDPETGQNLQSRTMVLNMPTGLNDVLSSDGKHIYLKSQVFDKDGRRGELGPHSGEPAKQGAVQRGETAHLFAPFDGFLDGDWFHRSYWVFGRSFAGGHSGYHQAGKYAPAGRILVFDEQNVYGFGRKPQYYRWTTPLEHQLFCADRVPLEPQTAKPAPANMVQVPNAPTLDPANKAVAVEAWVKAEKPDGVVVARGGPTNGFALVLRGGVPRFVVRSSDERFFAAAGKKKTLGDWHHLAGVLTADKQLKIYLDGQLAGTKDVPRLIAEEPKQDMEIGSDEAGAVGDYRSPFALGGLIDDVKVYFGTLTDQEIARHASGGPSDSTAANAELVFHATFDDGTAKDRSGKGHDGEVVGIASAPGKFGTALRFQAKRRAAPRYYVVHKWTRDVPLLVRAMAKCGDKLFLMGPPDVLDEDAAFTAAVTPALAAKLKAQDDAIRGDRGSVLMVVSATDGEVLAQTTHPELPRWDGMAAANGRLFVATERGNLVCLGE